MLRHGLALGALLTMACGGGGAALDAGDTIGDAIDGAALDAADDRRHRDRCTSTTARRWPATLRGPARRIRAAARASTGCATAATPAPRRRRATTCSCTGPRSTATRRRWRPHDRAPGGLPAHGDAVRAAALPRVRSCRPRSARRSAISGWSAPRWLVLRAGGDLGVWSGANLLHGGCSMGATRYPVVAARYPADASWLGTGKNGVCMSDGVVDLRAQDAFVGAGTGTRAAPVATAASPARTPARRRCRGTRLRRPARAVSARATRPTRGAVPRRLRRRRLRRLRLDRHPRPGRRGVRARGRRRQLRGPALEARHRG
jgi:hypothetical protein